MTPWHVPPHRFWCILPHGGGPSSQCKIDAPIFCPEYVRFVIKFAKGAHYWSKLNWGEFQKSATWNGHVGLLEDSWHCHLYIAHKTLKQVGIFAFQQLWIFISSTLVIRRPGWIARSWRILQVWTKQNNQYPISYVISSGFTSFLSDYFHHLLERGEG